MAQQRKIAQLEDEVAEVTETLRYTQEKLENNEAMSQKQLERERGRWDEERKMAMEEVVQVTQRRIHLMSEMELLEEENSRLQVRMMLCEKEGKGGNVHFFIPIRNIDSLESPYIGPEEEVC